jgi:2',3'-cyclic-nucleotide 2'-phosphodiesterase (5'-nucleotidase family)
MNMTKCWLTPLFWEDADLVPARTLEPLDAAASGTLTILHTNDLHSSVDARPGPDLGGLERIASTIEAARAAGPTLVVDSGDSVFGGGTWWCAVDAGATSRLMTVAGYDLAAIGNHDLERGPHSLRELLSAGRRLVSTNLAFEDEDLRTRIPPAWVVELGGLRLGVLGFTTAMTLKLVPRGVLAGVRYLNMPESALRAVAALSPSVHTIVILSHLGFDNDYDSDIHLIPALRGTKVSAVLGGHTHEALDPAYVIDGITACNAGAHGINVNHVTLTRNANESIVVRSKLVPQDDSVPSSERFLTARSDELTLFQELRETRVRMTSLEVAASPTPPTGASRDREMTLLTRALGNSPKFDARGVAMVPHLYVIGQLPESDTVSRLDVLATYPNAEQLVEVSLSGRVLTALITLQSQLRFYFSALPIWLSNGLEVMPDQIDGDAVYNVVMSELAAEGGLGWTPLQHVDAPMRAPGITCADVVWDYLARLS